MMNRIELYPVDQVFILFILSEICFSRAWHKGVIREP